MDIIQSKYIADLGIDVSKSIYDELPPTRLNELYQERLTYGFDGTDCYNLDDTMITWIYCHLKKLQDDSEGIIDWDFHLIDFNNEEYTLRQAIQYIVDRLEVYLLYFNKVEELYLELMYPDDNIRPDNYQELCEESYSIEINVCKITQDAFRMLAEILFYLWW